MTNFIAGKNHIIVITLFAVILVFIIIRVIIFLRDLRKQTKRVLNNDSNVPDAPEKEIESWKAYSNHKYNFTIEVPSLWHEQDYSLYYQNRGTCIAFSPNHLPPPTSLYTREGYFSVRVYNEQTDPQRYNLYMQNVKKIGVDDNYHKTQIDDKSGVINGNIVAVENLDWVYEISFDKNEGKANASESKIFQRVLTSFRFRVDP